MVRPAIRVVLVLLVGALAGRILGPLFVPDPTGVTAGILAATSAGLIAWYLYRSGWLREEDREESVADQAEV